MQGLLLALCGYRVWCVLGVSTSKLLSNASGRRPAEMMSTGEGAKHDTTADREAWSHAWG